jgi:hypothetical protein
LQLWRINETAFDFRTAGNQFLGIGASDGLVVATATTPRLPETFQIVRSPFDKNRVRIKAANGYFVQVLETSLLELHCRNQLACSTYIQSSMYAPYLGDDCRR